MSDKFCQLSGTFSDKRKESDVFCCLFTLLGTFLLFFLITPRVLTKNPVFFLLLTKLVLERKSRSLKMAKKDRDSLGDPIDRSPRDKAGMLVTNPRPLGLSVMFQRPFNKFFLFRHLSPTAFAVGRKDCWHVFVFTRAKHRLAIVKTKVDADFLVEKWKVAVNNRWLVFDVSSLLRFRERSISLF
jgi:hypothetical protein